MDKWTVSKKLDSTISIVNEGRKKALCFDMPLEIDQEVETEEFSYLLLEKRGVLESDIRVARIKNKNHEKIVGWLIPLTALESADHSQAEDTHFLTAASLAIKLILEDLADKSTDRLSGWPEERLTLATVFNEECVVFVYQPAAMGVMAEVERLPPILLTNGYYLRVEGKFGDVRHQISAQESHGKDLYLEPPSSEISSYDLIAKIINNSFSVQENELLKFFLLYQSIELLIDLVLESEYRITARELAKEDIAVREISNRIKRMMEAREQRKRVSLLFREYCKIDIEASKMLETSCESFLIQFDEKPEPNIGIADLLYNVRNIVFHGYASLDEDEVDSKLKPIVDSLFLVLGCLVVTYDPLARAKAFKSLIRRV